MNLAVTTAVSYSGSHDGTYAGTPTPGSDVLLLDGETSTFFNSGSDYIGMTPWAGMADSMSVQFAIQIDTYTSDQIVVVWATTSLGGGNAYRIDIMTDLKVRIALVDSGVHTTELTSDTALTLGETYIITANFGPTSGDDVEIWINETLGRQHDNG